MSKVEKLSVALTPELAAKVRQVIESGDYASTSEVIRVAIRDWAERRELRAAKLAELRAVVDQGLASGIAPRRRSAEEIIADGRRRLDERKAVGQ